MKSPQKLDDFKTLSKDNLIEEMMKNTIKGGCCVPTREADGSMTDVFYEDTGEIYDF